MMTGRQPRISRSHPCYDLVQVIERLLHKRRQEAANGIVRGDPHWPRAWTPIELVESGVYGSYYKMRNGGLQNPPPLGVVMEIANYLECSIEERNDLLVAATYAPLAPPLQGAALERAMRVAVETAQYFPFPAYITTQDWNIHFWNDHLLALFDVPAALAEAVPPTQRNMLWLIFDPALPVYARLRCNIRKWEDTARFNVRGFKFENTLYRYETWYQELIQRLMTLPDFPAFWNDAEDASDPIYTVTIDNNLKRPVTVFGMPFRVTIAANYPQIIVYRPADAESRHILTELGVPTPDNSWGQAPGRRAWASSAATLDRPPNRNEPEPGFPLPPTGD